MAITGKQTALIHLAKKQLGLSDDSYRDILWRVAGKGSSRDLDRFGFNALMQEFARLGFKSDFAERNFGSRAPTMATSRQVAMIRDLWGRFTNGEGTDETFGKWLDKHFRVSALRFLPRALAPKVIAALKAMNARRLEREARAS